MAIVNFDEYLAKLTDAFTPQKHDIFVNNFAPFMEHRKNPDVFVVDLDDVVRWLGPSRKETATRFLSQHFFKDVNYITASPTSEAVQSEVRSIHPSLARPPADPTSHKLP